MWGELGNVIPASMSCIIATACAATVKLPIEICDAGHGRPSSIMVNAFDTCSTTWLSRCAPMRPMILPNTAA